MLRNIQAEARKFNSFKKREVALHKCEHSLRRRSSAPIKKLAMSGMLQYETKLSFCKSNTEAVLFTF